MGKVEFSSELDCKSDLSLSFSIVGSTTASCSDNCWSAVVNEVDFFISSSKSLSTGDASELRFSISGGRLSFTTILFESALDIAADSIEFPDASTTISFLFSFESELTSLLVVYLRLYSGGKQSSI